MQPEYLPVVVVVAFDRVKSLNRILSSLDKSYCPSGTKLVVSIDNNGTNEDVFQAAQDFNWKFGEKEVIYQKERLGLKKHIIKCGDLSFKYGSVIILEDDLYVSPYFYKYTIDSLSYYKDSEEIAGISLFNLPYTESCKLPFTPIKDDSDVYFKQVPSSLGQAWSQKHWSLFKKWYDTNPDILEIYGLPPIVKKWWPETSWKKYYYAYLVKHDKYFVFPQVSLTTSFNDLGTNMKTKSYFGQTPLKTVESEFKFKKLSDAVNVYDAYSELLPDRFAKLCDVLNDFNYEVDLYGRKDSFIADFVLTTKPCAKTVLSFERSLKPHELNIIYNLKGEEIFLAKKEDVLFYPTTVDHLKYNRTTQDFINEFTYFYKNAFDTDVLMRVFKYRVLNKIKALFNKEDKKN